MKKLSKLVKKETKKEIGTDSHYSFCGSIDDVIKYLQEKKENYQRLGYTDINIDLREMWGYYDDHWTEIVYYGCKSKE